MHQFVLVITACAILIFGDMVYSEPLVGAYSERVEMIDVGRGDVKVYVPSHITGRRRSHLSLHFMVLQVPATISINTGNLLIKWI